MLIKPLKLPFLVTQGLKFSVWDKYIGTVYVTPKNCVNNPLDFAKLIHSMEHICQAFASKGVRARWVFHLDETKNGYNGPKTGNYEHAHAWLIFDGFYDGFNLTEQSIFVKSICMPIHRGEQRPSCKKFSLPVDYTRKPWPDDKVYSCGDRNLAVMEPREIMEMFPQVFRDGGADFEWGRSVQVYGYGSTAGVVLCHEKNGFQKLT